VIQYYISIHHTHIQDIDRLLTDLVVNSEFGDLSRYVRHGTTGVPVPRTDSSVSLAQAQAEAQADASRPTGINEPPPGVDPDIWLINLSVLSACTRLRLDPWHHSSGYAQYVATHYWHPSFGVLFRDFLGLIHSELRDPQLDQSGLGEGSSIPTYPLPYSDDEQDQDQEHHNDY
jgi:hypothetical protein